MKVIINVCFGGFGLSDAAYEWLIAHGIPAQRYVDQERDAETGLYKPQTANDGRVIFDRSLVPEGADKFNDFYWQNTRRETKSRLFGNRYWDSWTSGARSDPLIVQCVEELRGKSFGACAQLRVVEIPDGVEYEIDEYDGNEHVAEKHRTWG